MKKDAAAFRCESIRCASPPLMRRIVFNSQRNNQREKQLCLSIEQANRRGINRFLHSTQNARCLNRVQRLNSTMLIVRRLLNSTRKRSPLLRPFIAMLCACVRPQIVPESPSRSFSSLRQTMRSLFGQRSTQAACQVTQRAGYVTPCVQLEQRESETSIETHRDTHLSCAGEIYAYAHKSNVHTHEYVQRMYKNVREAIFHRLSRLTVYETGAGTSKMYRMYICRSNCTFSHTVAARCRIMFEINGRPSSVIMSSTTLPPNSSARDANGTQN